MIHRSRLPLVVLGVAVIAGCGNSPDEYEGPKRFPLSGKVTLDGAPVDGGTIAFIQQEEKQRPSGGMIVAGQYTIPEAQGANAGTYRVEVRWLKPTGKQYKDEADTGEMVDEVAEAIPGEYNDSSTLSASVSETSTTFDFDLKSK